MRAAMKLKNDLQSGPAQLSARLFCRSRRPAGVAVFRSPRDVGPGEISHRQRFIRRTRLCTSGRTAKS